MSSLAGSCQHLEGLRSIRDGVHRCPVCRAELDAGGVARWVREAEESRDAAYSLGGEGEFGEIAWEEGQREVYRRRKVMYETQSIPRITTVRPEMVLVIHDPAAESYECRVFYKEPRPEHGMERFSVSADLAAILELRSDSNLVLRIAASKVEEFHLARGRLFESGEPVPGRRVFYANEL